MSVVTEVSGPDKVDFTELFSHLYRASDRHGDVVNVPRMHFVVSEPQDAALTEDGFRAIARAMRRLSLNIQLTVKAANVMDYRSMPLECIWEPADAMADGAPGPSRWMLMIMQPVVNHRHFEQECVRFRESGEMSCGTDLSLKVFTEGLSAQMLHRGPVFEEWKTRAKLRDYIETHGYQTRGNPHTIYLHDPGDVNGKGMTSIVRQPIAPLA